MRHLCNTFIDGGCKSEKAWLEPLLATSLNENAAKHLRLSADVDKLFHACAKGLGEGFKLYGLGEGAKNHRPYLEKHWKHQFHLALQRFDNGCRQDGKTQVVA